MVVLKALLVAFAFVLISASTVFADAPGITKDRILIGRSSAFTGAGAAHNALVNKGSKIYIDKINAAGGVHGRKIEVLTYDDAYDPAKALENVKKLIEEAKVFVMFENYGSAANKAIMPYLDKTDVPLLAAMTSAEEFRAPVKKNIFLVRASSHIEIAEGLKFVVNKLGLKKIAVVYQDDSLGNGARLATTAALRDLNLKLTFDGSIPRNTQDIDSEIEGLVKSGAEVVVLGMQIAPSANLIRKATSKGFKPVYLGGTTIANKEFISQIASENPKFYFSSAVPVVAKHSPHEIVKQFLKDARDEADEGQLEGYLNAMVLVEALKRAGKEPTRESFRKALYSMKDQSFGGVKVTYSPDSHRGSSMVFMGMLKDGAFTPVEK